MHGNATRHIHVQLSGRFWRRSRPDALVLVADNGAVAVSGVLPGLCHQGAAVSRSTPGCRTRTSKRPTAGSVLLAGVLLKMGTYGLIRFSLPLFPHMSHLFAPLISVLAIIGIIYGALVAMVQPDMKKLVAYSSVSHMGFIVLGIFSFNDAGSGRRSLSNAQSRCIDRRIVPAGRRDLRTASHAADRRIWRPRESYAGLCRGCS